MARFGALTRSTAVAAALGVALSAGAVGMPLAGAEVTYGDESPVVNPARTGSLTIHKYANPNSEKAPTGLKDQEVDGGATLDGVGFTVYRITDINVTTNEGLKAAAGIKPTDYVTNGVANPALIGNRLEVVGGGQQLTDTAGEIELSGLQLGAYLVVETQPKSGYTPAAPFIAFVPMTQANDGENQGVSWFYDVHAYPKNYSAPEHEKTVVDKDQNVDGTVTYDIVGTVRQLSDGEKLKDFRITDTIDSALTIESVAVALGGQLFVEGVDYESNPINGQNVNVQLTETGLGKLTSKAQVKVTVTTKVDTDVQSTDGMHQAPNGAKVYQNNPGSDQATEEDGKPTNKVYTYWGDLKFTKVDGNDKPLAGAEFQIVRSNDKCEDINVSNKDAINNAAVYGVHNGASTNTFVSNDKGEVVVSGLHVNDFADNEVVDPASWYCLVETKAPKGKELLAEPLEFQLIATTVDINDPKGSRVYQTASVTSDGKVVNLDDTTPLLPQTGGAGIALLVLASLGLIGGGAAWARRNSV